MARVINLCATESASGSHMIERCRNSTTHRKRVKHLLVVGSFTSTQTESDSQASELRVTPRNARDINVVMWLRADCTFIEYQPVPTPLSPEAIAQLRRRYQMLRGDYFDYLSAVGWGATKAGPTTYESPIEPGEVFGQGDEHAGILLLGDDYQGYCFGYNAETECYGEISDDGRWEQWPKTQGIVHYVTDPNDNAS